jgi:hypothetical protein
MAVGRESTGRMRTAREAGRRRESDISALSNAPQQEPAEKGMRARRKIFSLPIPDSLLTGICRRITLVPVFEGGRLQERPSW